MKKFARILVLIFLGISILAESFFINFWIFRFQPLKQRLHACSFFALLFLISFVIFIRCFISSQWFRSINKFFSLAVPIFLLFSICSWTSIMKYLLFCKNLIFWNIYFLETFIITLFTFLLCNHISPIFIVCIYQILNFKSDSCLQIFIISLFYKILTYFITIFKINIFIFCAHRLFIFLNFVLSLNFGLFTQVNHKFIDHVAQNFNILIILFLQ